MSLKNVREANSENNRSLRWWNPRSLSFRLIGPVFAVIVVLAVLITYYEYIVSKEHFEKNVHSQLQTAAHIADEQVAITLALGDTPQLQMILKSFTLYGQFIYSSVFDVDGKCIVSVIKDEPRFKASRTNIANRSLTLSAKGDETIQSHFSQLDDGKSAVYEIVVPLYVLNESSSPTMEIPELLPPEDLPLAPVEDRDRVGSLRIGLSAFEGLAVLKKVNFKSFGRIVVVALFAFVIVSILIQRTVSRIQEIATCADNVVGGRLDQRVKIVGSDEVSSLGESFNSMMERLDNARILEKCLQRSQKLAAIGEIAAGVAHEFNNVLQIISTHAELAALDTDGNYELEDNLKVILDSSDRASKIVGSLLTFSKRRKIQHSMVNVEARVAEVIGLMTPQFNLVNIVVKTNFIHVPYANIGEEQLQQVLMNLFSNATHAMMPLGGTLTVATDLVPCNLCRQLTKGIRLTSVKHDEEPETMNYNATIKIIVSDTGKGIPPEDLDRIFDPFYSTKGVYSKSNEEQAISGTGIGLTVCYGIITNNYGDIQVKSEPGKGTTFTVTLPAFRKNDILKDDDKGPVFNTPPYLAYKNNEDQI